ncbi:hypothetical protein HD554DRAFT_2166798 [Boletus coccyginus]|nr:hypothetical protein HD554DRAFT_2166798 [Boletus coccyginus]
MSLTPFKNILALGQAPSINPAKADTIKEVTELKIQLDSIPGDMVHEVAEVIESSPLIVSTHEGTQHRYYLNCMQQVNVLSHQWLSMATIQKWQEEKYTEVVAWAMKAVLAQAARMVSLGEPEEVTVSEKWVGSALPGPIQDLANELPMTESPSKEQESVLSTGQKWKHVSSWVVVDEKKDEDDEIIEVITLKPSRAKAGSKTVMHDSLLKMKCGKLKGKGAKLKKDMALVLGSKVKRKEKGHPRPGKNSISKPVLVILSSRVEAKVSNFFGFSPLPESDSHQEDNDVMPYKKAKTLNPATHAAIKMMKLMLLTMRTKMHRMLRFLTKLQAHVKVAETYITSQQLEIEEMKALLELL